MVCWWFQLTGKCIQGRFDLKPPPTHGTRTRRFCSTLLQQEWINIQTLGRRKRKRRRPRRPRNFWAEERSPSEVTAKSPVRGPGLPPSRRWLGWEYHLFLPFITLSSMKTYQKQGPGLCTQALEVYRSCFRCLSDSCFDRNNNIPAVTKRCLMEEVGVPRTSTHWMGLETTQTTPSSVTPGTRMVGSLRLYKKPRVYASMAARRIFVPDNFSSSTVPQPSEHHGRDVTRGVW